MDFHQPNDKETLRVAISSAITATAVVGWIELARLQLDPILFRIVGGGIALLLTLNVSYLVLSAWHHRYIHSGKPTARENKLEHLRQSCFSDQVILLGILILLSLIATLVEGYRDIAVVVAVVYALIAFIRIFFISF